MNVTVNSDVKLVCVEHPAVVENVNTMLATLGDETTISKTVSDPTRRLELRWRPDDPYCKPACGDRYPATSLLLRVRRRKKKACPETIPDASNTGQMPTNYEYKGEVMGVIDTVYKFNSMMDFQYLPMEKSTDTSEFQTLLDKLVIGDLEERKWLDLEAPLFLPPPIFSRIDNPIDYSFRDAPKHRDGYRDPSFARPDNLIGVARQRRPHYTRFATFDEEFMPDGPYQQALDKLKVKLKDETKINKLKKLFDERPIWSKNALKAHISLTPEQFKYALPTVAYYFITGPWRSLWVRLGYDPRQDPSAKKYQLVDFRVRQKSAADKLNINTKRSTYQYSLPNTVNKSASQAALIQQETFKVDWKRQRHEDSKEDKKQKEATFRFRPGLVPAYRQMFYQLCDIEEEEIQALVHSNDGEENDCSEKDGWCVPDTQEQCRQILAKYLKAIINKSSKSASDSKESDAVEDTEQESHDQNTEDESDSDSNEGEQDEEENEMEMEMFEYMAPETEVENDIPEDSDVNIDLPQDKATGN